MARRLGRVLEEWLKYRTESAPDRGALADLSRQVAALSQHISALDDRFELLSERQDFMESLSENRRVDMERAARLESRD